MNIIDVDCRLLVCYSGVKSIRSPSLLLGSTKECLRWIYALQVVLRNLVSENVEAWKKDGLRSWKLKDDDDAIEVHGMNVGDLFFPHPQDMDRY